MLMLDRDGNNKTTGIQQDQSFMHERHLNQKKRLRKICFFSFPNGVIAEEENVLMQY